MAAKKSVRTATRKASKAAAAKPKLLSSGNPQIPKGDGDASVQAYIAAMPGWKGDVGRRLDAVVARAVPKARKAVRWNTPFYGVEGKGWFLAMYCYNRYVQLAFLRGAALRPLPPGESKQKDVRYLNIHEGEWDEASIARWVKRAAALPGAPVF